MPSWEYLSICLALLVLLIERLHAKKQHRHLQTETQTIKKEVITSLELHMDRMSTFEKRFQDTHHHHRQELQQAFFNTHQLLEAKSEHLKDTVLRSFHDSQSFVQGRLSETIQLQYQHFETFQSHLQNFYNTMIQQLQKLDKQVETQLSDNLKEGFHHFGKIQEHLQLATLKLNELKIVGESIEDLNRILKLPHLRGSFGESELEKILADFLPVTAYELQAKVDPQSLERVDALVRVNQKWLPIDSKFPRESLLPLFENSDTASQNSARKALSSWTKTQARSIAQKYIRPDCGTADLAFLFLPSENLYFEIIRDLECFQAITKMRVFPVSPNTLALSLQAIQLAQENYLAAQNITQTLEDLQKARKYFAAFSDKFSGIGTGLKKAQENFDLAHQQLNRYESSIIRLESHELAHGTTLEQ